MNTIITKIAVEAQVEHCISHVRLQKFAELIVRECMRKINVNGSQIECEIEEDIKQHFGVEE